jgi:hypothetical protein
LQEISLFFLQTIGGQKKFTRQATFNGCCAPKWPSSGSSGDGLGNPGHDDSLKGSQGNDWVDSYLAGVTARRRIVLQDLKQKQ